MTRKTIGWMTVLILLVAALALLCTGVLCSAQSLDWVGKRFPGFLVLDNGVVADFLRGLNTSVYFVNVDLVKTGRGSTVGGVRLVQFEITADLVAPADIEGDGEQAGA